MEAESWHFLNILFSNGFLQNNLFALENHWGKKQTNMWDILYPLLGKYSIRLGQRIFFFYTVCLFFVFFHIL